MLNNTTVETNKFMSFGQAVEALNQGKMVQRNGWNGKGLFVFKQVPATIMREVVPKMQSLPDAVKAKFEERFNNPYAQVDAIRYENQLALVDPYNLITGWAPSVSDSLAEDWVIYE